MIGFTYYMSRPSEPSYRIDFSQVFLDQDLTTLVYREEYMNPHRFECTEEDQDIKKKLLDHIEEEISKIKNHFTDEHCKEMLSVSPCGSEIINRCRKLIKGKANAITSEELEGVRIRLAVDAWLHTYSRYRHYGEYIYELYIHETFFNKLTTSLRPHIMFERCKPHQFCVYVSGKEVEAENLIENLKHRISKIKTFFTLSLFILAIALAYSLLNK